MCMSRLCQLCFQIVSRKISFCDKLWLDSRHIRDAGRSHRAWQSSLFAHGCQRSGHVVLAWPRAAGRPPARPAGDGLPGALLLLLQRQVQGLCQQLILIILQVSQDASVMPMV